MTRIINSAIVLIALGALGLIIGQSPWHRDSTTFLFRPLIEFCVPLVIVQYLLRTSQDRVLTILRGGVLLTSICAMALLMDWPASYEGVAWEDSYQTIDIFLLFVHRFCWPLWIGIGSVLLLKIRLHPLSN